jgi:hypothetical protein
VGFIRLRTNAFYLAPEPWATRVRAGPP